MKWRPRFAWFALLIVAWAPGARAAGTPADSARVSELERKVDVLTSEIERIKLGETGAAPVESPGAGKSLGPSVSKVYRSRPGVSFGGYGELLLNTFERHRQDGEISGTRNQVNLLRAVIYAGYKFNDQLLLNSELEWESGGVLDQAGTTVDSTGSGSTRLSGEGTVEFAYLDWAPHRELGVRAGKLLVPVGITNEMHEPPVLIGAMRPDVETRIIPTTWSAAGVGVFGALSNGLSYRAYLIEGLDGAGFTAATAIRGGRQNASQAMATRPGGVLRIDYDGLSMVTFGASYYAGHSWQRDQPPGMHLDPIARISEIHARYQQRGLEARALYANGTLSQAVELSNQLGLVGAERLGKAFFGGYVEAAYDVMPEIAAGSSIALLPYVRYDESDTQDLVEMPGIDDPEHHWTALSIGLALKPVTGIAVKGERQQRRTEAHTATSQWNLSLGWMF